ncbi:hypothetical protein SAMN05428959_1011149 [Duganella sp. CF517]|uniref:hypothetical protein n=1 Tax=Duganella sp. CF517 TaxID=1881038 RepID=UPI0008AAC6A1|nr:hypothetical protein [Duganella sp. CF517]SEN31732.1 hypothetical protein SAMN05428959_1011149 [Duganella sp. CF517]
MTSTSTSTTPAEPGRDSFPFQMSMHAALAARAKLNYRTASAEAVALIERGMLVANPIDFLAAGDAQKRRRADQVATQVIDCGLEVERQYAEAAKVQSSATVDQLIAAAFAGPRSPRSAEYKAGAHPSSPSVLAGRRSPAPMPPARRTTMRSTLAKLRGTLSGAGLSLQVLYERAHAGSATLARLQNHRK